MDRSWMNLSRCTSSRTSSTINPTYPDIAYHQYARQDDMEGMLQDAFNMHSYGEQLFPPDFIASDDCNIGGNVITETGTSAPNEEPNEEVAKFYNLFNEMNEELYDGSKYLKLSFCIRLFHLKCLGGWTGNSFTMLLDLLREMFPFAKIPQSCQDMKRLIKDFGLGYDKIHSCPNDCMLYWGNQKNQQSCHVCGNSRWMNRNTEDVNVDEGGAQLRKKPIKLWEDEQPSNIQTKRRSRDESDDGSDEEDDPNEADLWKKKKTILNVDGKSKDNLQSRLDLVDMRIRRGLHPQELSNGKYRLSPLIFAMSKEEKEVFCTVLKDIKVPDAYASYISRCVPKQIEVLLLNYGEPIGKVEIAELDERSWVQAHRYVLFHHDSIEPLHKFHTKYRERLRRTQNCGIVVNSSITSYASARDSNPVEGNVEYYGLLTNIIKLDYYGKWKVVLFRCDWDDVNTARRIKNHKFSFTMVNFSGLIHTEEQLIDELYVFSSQVKQVFYSKDPTDEGKMCRRRLQDLSIVQNTPNSEEENSEQQTVIGSSNVPETLDDLAEFQSYLGIIARNANILPINYESWHHMPDSNKNQAFDNIKERFALEVSDDYIKALGKKWSDHRSTLKKQYFKKDISLEEILRNVPPGNVEVPMGRYG
ncbi:hypothetical protein PVK06_011793 [Gossypium arboreum]|uniref:DUF4216 domain-containing protein n=1 Tax=Gossypium arboreum TaxID=29729 RepID=A0ABR0Q9P6_GOSAR|nr:hypothetical protein PVK06_011793 [Gossypium arboreum]